MKKKLLALTMVSAMVLSLVACSSGSSTAPSTGDTAATEAGSATEETSSTAESSTDAQTTGDATDMKVAMVTDYGDITDQSFNQTTYEACKEWADVNGVEFTYFKPNGDSTADRVASVDQAVMEGYNVIVMPGYAFAGAIVEAAGNYPDVKFIALDVAAGDILSAALGDQYDWNPDNWDVTENYSTENTYCAIYQEELSGYMAGYAAVKLGYRKLGFLGGMAVPAVIRFGYGFVQGADAAAAELGEKVDMKYAYGNQFYGDLDITGKMDTWYQGGTEVVFACGGGIYTSAAEAAAKVDGKVIGVDVDQAAIIDGKYGEGMTVTSAAKGLATTVKDTLTGIKEGNWSNYVGKIETLGLVSGDDPTLNYVEIPMESTQWGDGFTQDDYKALVKDMFDGKIKVSDDISAAEPAAQNVNIDFQGNLK